MNFNFYLYLITEILLKVALNPITLILTLSNLLKININQLINLNEVLPLPLPYLIY